MRDLVTRAPGTLALQRPFLYRYALFRLRKTEAAEDVVQDTFVAALEGGTAFRGEAALRTWLAAILRHKISDWHRREARDLRSGRGPAASRESDREGDDASDRLFDSAGAWVTPPSELPHPDRLLESKELGELIERCMATLPCATARAFYLREIEGLTTREICAELGVSESNCCVMLYRARMRLRQYLDEHWPRDEERSAKRGAPAGQADGRAAMA